MRKSAFSTVLHLILKLEMKGMGLSMEVAEAVGRLWETVIKEMGPDSDFTSAIKPIEKAAGVEVRGRPAPGTGK